MSVKGTILEMDLINFLKWADLKLSLLLESSILENFYFRMMSLDLWLCVIDAKL